MARKVSIAQVMDQSGVAFGTSGARGLVVAMTDEVCYTYTLGFLQYLAQQGDTVRGGRVAVAGDLRASTPRIMRAVMKAIVDRGCVPVNAGRVPSPAVALYGFDEGIPSIMVTGSHIPDDRNGIKFNRPKSELLKSDEPGMKEQVVELPPDFAAAAANMADSLQPALEKQVRDELTALAAKCSRAVAEEPGISHGRPWRDVIVAADIPGDNDVGPIQHDDPILADGIVQFVGQPVFAVAATSVRRSRSGFEIVLVRFGRKRNLITSSGQALSQFKHMWHSS